MSETTKKNNIIPMMSYNPLWFSHDFLWSPTISYVFDSTTRPNTMQIYLDTSWTGLTLQNHSWVQFMGASQWNYGHGKSMCPFWDPMEKLQNYCKQSDLGGLQARFYQQS